MFEQAILRRAVVKTAQFTKNQKALSRLHAQVLRLNKTVKEANGESHLKLIES